MKTVYLSFATDIIHGGHINIISKAAELGRVIVGVQTDQVVMRTLRYPLLPLSERMRIISQIKGVSEVVVQDELYYDKILRQLKPDFVVHGDDWRTGYLSGVRRRVIEVLKEWGGQLVEFPYTRSPSISALENLFYDRLGVPEVRRARLKRMLEDGQIVSAMEAHSGLSGLIVEKARVEVNGEARQFDAIWISSLCDSTIKGKPDIELVDMTSRIGTIEEILEVTTKPIIVDGDTGGLAEHFAYTVRTLERIGVSAVVIEDKTGPKRNSLFGDEVEQHQDSVESCCNKIRVGKMASRTREFMVVARCESLVLGKGIQDALSRCSAYVEAGADGVMIHSKSRSPVDVFAFCDEFTKLHPGVPVVCVPTTYNSVTQSDLVNHRVRIIIYENHLVRSAFPAMKRTAECILRNGRSLEADEYCMPVGEILTLIPCE